MLPMLGQNQGSIPTCTLNSFNQMIQDAGQKNFTERHLEKRDKHKESARNLAKKNKLITISINDEVEKSVHNNLLFNPDFFLNSKL